MTTLSVVIIIGTTKVNQISAIKKVINSMEDLKNNGFNSAEIVNHLRFYNSKLSLLKDGRI